MQPTFPWSLLPFGQEYKSPFLFYLKSRSISSSYLKDNAKNDAARDAAFAVRRVGLLQNRHKHAAHSHPRRTGHWLCSVFSYGKRFFERQISENRCIYAKRRPMLERRFLSSVYSVLSQHQRKQPAFRKRRLIAALLFVILSFFNISGLSHNPSPARRRPEPAGIAAFRPPPVRGWPPH